MIRALAITGPTASGKTSLSLGVAEALSGEIISCDSMQIYRGMDIGTAKATPEERARARHHMIDLCDPSQVYSAEDYKQAAMAVALDITKRGRLPLFVGGTGLYIDTVMRGGEVQSPPSDAAVRERLMAIAETEDGRIALWKRLSEIDPESAEKNHYNNARRVVRALEIYELSGKTKSYFDELSRAVSADIDVKMITLDFHDRDTLYKRVDMRVDEMMREGLLSEVERLYLADKLKPEYTSSQAIGYKEIVSYLKGECTLDEAIELIKLSSRRYAKRQLTWFRHEKDAYRLYIDDVSGRLRPSEDVLCEALEYARSSLSR
ncbi:MAG: tRNA (adenosine(37)-N6)-dimethylallyltransferase MiaA [Clostridia bacterium]|nr:tRNA (adenosine(37)-N6)-dimethylallyltransferase MiaA [Clostridia bacterium]